MLRQLMPYMRKYRLRILSGFVFIITGNFIGVINPQIVRRAIDYLEQQIEVRQLIIFAGLIVAISFLQGVFRFLMRRTIIVVSRLIENDIRNELFGKLQTLSDAFYQRNSTGDIMARMTNDLNAIRSVLGPGLMYTFNTATMFVFVIIMMLKISWLLTLIAMIPIPLMVITVNRMSTQVNKRFSAVQAQFSAISTKVQENLAGMRIVKSYVLEKPEIEDFNRLNREYIEKSMHHVKVQAAFRPVMMLIIGLGVSLILLFGGRLIIDGTITLGQFVAFNLYLGMLVWPSIALGWVMGVFYQGVASMKRLDHILKAEPDIYDADRVVPLNKLNGSVCFKNLNFSYPGDRQKVLENVSLEAEPGQIIAIVGRTGSGKTSLVKLLLRIYDPPEGSLLIDDHDIRSIPLKTLRRQIGYIPQDTFLFSDSIRNNIIFGNDAAAEDEIEQAARAAQIHDSIMEFPGGYDTMLGERGINLSGGQKQRLSIARAILKKPRILILDDALSAVDTVTEEAILNNLRRIMKDKTCFWISHRISSIKDADFIVVLDEGRIAEQGRHEDLLMFGGIYADMFEKQQLEETLQVAE